VLPAKPEAKRREKGKGKAPAAIPAEVSSILKRPERAVVDRDPIVRLARGQPAGFWDGPVQAGIPDDPVRLGGAGGRTALARVGRRAAGQR